jgi:hypothetical protein
MDKAAILRKETKCVEKKKRKVEVDDTFAWQG